MARTTKPPASRSADLARDQIERAIPLLEKRIADLDQFKISTAAPADDPSLKALQHAIESSAASIFGPESHEYKRLESAFRLNKTNYLRYLGVRGHPGPDSAEVAAGIRQGIEEAKGLLRSTISGLKDRLDLMPGTPSIMPKIQPAPSGTEPIFIVHGRDSPAKIEVARFVESAGLKATILHEAANEGKTIIEKFEKHGNAAGFAIVVATPDDVGGLDKDHLNPRARQNVIGEMFWFAGRLSRERVCVLKKGDIEMPSDFAGVGYVDMDDRGAWKMELGRELQAAGYNINWANAMK